MSLLDAAAANRARLLRDVAQAIIESGYAVEPRKPYQARKNQIAWIAQDARLYSHAKHTQAALIDDVMAGCDIDRAGARVLICKARKLRSNHA